MDVRFRGRVLFLAVVLLGVGLPPGRPADFLRGDVDVSGEVTIADIVLIYALVWPETILPCRAAADVNGNHSINIADAAYILAFLFYGGRPPAAPYPELGPPDPELDPSCYEYNPTPVAVDDGIVIDVQAQADDYESGVEYPAVVRISTAEFPVDGWSLSITTDEAVCRITGVTTAGTAVERAFSSFAVTELTSGPGNDGAVSAVFVRLPPKVGLPLAESPHEVLALRWTPAPSSPEGSCLPCRFRIVQDLRGSGEPVPTRVVRWGKEVIPAVGNMEVDSCASVPRLPGDCNRDETLDIADPVFLLLFLFTGGRRPEHTPLCDANQDASLDIADAVRSLDFLFRGGPSLPPVLR